MAACLGKRPILSVIYEGRPLPLLSGWLGDWESDDYAPGVPGLLRCRGVFTLIAPRLLQGHRCLIVLGDERVPVMVERAAMNQVEGHDAVTHWHYSIVSSGEPAPRYGQVVARSAQEIARDTAARLVRVGPELTGFATPRHFWVYLGDCAIHGGARTEEEAERLAARHRQSAEAAILEAILEAKATT